MTRAVARLLVIVVVVLAPAAAATARAQVGWPEEFSAIGVDPTIDPASPTCVDIRINRWATAHDEEMLARALRAGGPDALLDAVRDVPAAGVIASPGSLRWSLRFAWQFNTADGGRRIVMLTDRPIGGWELMTARRRSTIRSASSRSGSRGRATARAKACCRRRVEGADGADERGAVPCVLGVLQHRPARGPQSAARVPGCATRGRPSRW